MTARDSRDFIDRFGPGMSGGDQVPAAGLHTDVDAMRLAKIFGVVVGSGQRPKHVTRFDVAASLCNV